MAILINFLLIAKFLFSIQTLNCSFIQDVKVSLFQRQRNILYLIVQYLDDHGLKQAKSSLLTEANLSNDFRVCDNIDLDTIYLDFCSYFHMRFGKQPKIVKRNEFNEIAAIETNKTKPTKAKNNEVVIKKFADCQQSHEINKNVTEPFSCEIVNVMPDMHCIKNLKNDSICVNRRNNDIFRDFNGEMLDLAYIIERF